MNVISHAQKSRFPDVVACAQADAESIRRCAGESDMFSFEEEI